MNPELLEQVYNDALNSAGSAAEENAKYLDSIVGKTTQFKNELQELEANALDSELIKGVVDFGTTLLSILNMAGDKLPEIIRLVGALAVAITMAKNELNIIGYDASQGLNLFGKFNLNKENIASVKETFQKVGTTLMTWFDDVSDKIETSWLKDPDNLVNDFFGGIETLASEGVEKGKELATGLINGFKNNMSGVFENDKVREFFELSDMADSEEEIGAIFDDLDDSTQQLITDLQSQGITTMEEFAAAEDAAGLSAKLASVGVQLLNSAITMGLTLLATWAISKITEEISDLSTASETASKDFDSFNKKLQEVVSESREQSKYIADNKDEYAELAKEVDEFGNNISLSSDEFARYNDISNQLAEMFPSMVKGWTESGDAILYEAGNVKALNEELRKNKELSYASLLTDNAELTPSAVFENYEELKHANFFEKLKAKDKTLAGVSGDYDELYAQVSAFAELTYEDFQNMYQEIMNAGGLLGTLDDKSYKAANAASYILHVPFYADENSFEAARIQAQAYVNTFDMEMENALKGMRDLGSAYLELNPDYDTLDDDSRKIAQMIVNSLDRELADSFDNDPIKLGAWVANVVKDTKQMSIPLSNLFSIDTRSGSFEESRQQMQDAWAEFNKVINDEIAKNADNPEEQERLRKYRDAVFEQSGMGDVNKFSLLIHNSMSAISKDANELQDVTEYTKHFTQEQWELWLKCTNATMNATEAIKAYEKQASKLSYYKFDSIGALLSQDTIVEGSLYEKRYRELEEVYDKELALAKEKGADLNRTLFGNVDLNDRDVLEWNEENIEKYKDAIESWGVNASSFLGSISTVDGQSSEFHGIEIAFTPMLQTDHGAEYLDRDTVENYINTLMSQLPDKWNDEDLLELDIKGTEINGKYIQGLIAGIGDEARKVGEIMHFLGKDGALEYLKKQMQDVHDEAVTWGDIKQDLVGLAQAGKLDENTLKQYKYFDEILKALGMSAKEAEEQISGMVDAINKFATNNLVDDMANYRTEMDKLGDAYKKFQNKELIDANTLSALQDAFGDLDSYQEFEKAVLSGETQLQSYFDSIVSEYAYAHNILRNLNEDNAEYTKQCLIRAGVTKESAEAAVKEALEEKKVLEGRVTAAIENANTDAVRKENLKELVVDTSDLSAATLEEINDLIKETGITGDAANMIRYYAIQKDLAEHSDMRNQDDIEYLIQVCELAGIAANSLSLLKQLSANEGNYNDIINKADAIINKYAGKKNLNPGQQAELNYWLSQKEFAENSLADLTDLGNKAWDEVVNGFHDQYSQYEYKPELDYGGVVDDAAKGGEDAAKAFKEALDKILALYDAELDAGVIAFQEYVNKSRAIIEQYYREGKITAAEYYDYLASFYEKQVKEYDRVIQAVQDLIDEQIEQLEEQKTKIEESYNEQIEVIQKKIDSLQEENEEIDKNIALQKAQWKIRAEKHGNMFKKTTLYRLTA